MLSQYCMRHPIGLVALHPELRRTSARIWYPMWTHMYALFHLTLRIRSDADTEVNRHGRRRADFTHETYSLPGPVFTNIRFSDSPQE